MASGIAPRTRSSERRAEPAAPPAFSVPEVVERFQRMLQAQERSPCTVKQYGHIARTFLGYVGKPLDEVESRDVEGFREYLVLKRHYSKNSLYTTVRGLSCLFRSFGVGVERGLEPPRRPERLPRYLSEEETHRLFEAARDSPRDYAILHVLGFGGLRVGELCALHLEDVEFDRNLIHVRAGKGDKDREVVLEERTLSAIERYLAERAIAGVESLRLFPVTAVTVERMVRKRATQAGIQQHVTPHVLRHTLATALLRRGCDIRYIQKLLGHASVATTQIYTHVDTQALREAYRKARPEY